LSQGPFTGQMQCHIKAKSRAAMQVGRPRKIKEYQRNQKQNNLKEIYTGIHIQVVQAEGSPPGFSKQPADRLDLTSTVSCLC